MLSRREFLGALPVPAAAAAGAVFFNSKNFARAFEPFQGLKLTPEEAARDESLWVEVQQAFTVDRTIVNLNNGGVSPSPRIVQESMKRHLDLANTATAYMLWQIQEPQKETTRKQLAAAFGCDPEEMAITRNASESLQTCQFGFDLQRGDEVLTTNQDYPRMITTFQQRTRREGIVLKQFSIPVPCEDPAKIVRLFEENITPRTKLILMCHIINITGQILPVKEVVAMARKRGIPVIVDGAHAFAHFAFRANELGCDYYATSLHKWLHAPHGTGFLFVKKDRIQSLWPLMAANEAQDGDIRKFEEIGTHPAANTLAISEALAFYEGIGPERKEARLRYLRDTWAKRLLKNDRIRLHTSLDPRFSCAIATVEIRGIKPENLSAWLWKEQRILVTPIVHPEFEGIRVTPSVYTTLSELDRFAGAMEKACRNGLAN